MLFREAMIAALEATVQGIDAITFTGQVTLNSDDDVLKVQRQRSILPDFPTTPTAPPSTSGCGSPTSSRRGATVRRSSSSPGMVSAVYDDPDDDSSAGR